MAVYGMSYFSFGKKGSGKEIKRKEKKMFHNMGLP
jgi:hypothetical protein